MIRVAAAAALAGFVAVAVMPHTRAHERATVVDGDTIRIRGERVRIIGLDAPELEARCPREAVIAHRANERMDSSCTASTEQLRSDSPKSLGLALYVGN